MFLQKIDVMVLVNILRKAAENNAAVPLLEFMKDDRDFQNSELQFVKVIGNRFQNSIFFGQIRGSGVIYKIT